MEKGMSRKERNSRIIDAMAFGISGALNRS